MNALHPLGQLIQSVEDSKGWTMREIARRAERAKVPLSNAYLGKLKRQGIRSITIETIHALSVGLDVSERVVALAAVESMGVHDVNPFEEGAAVAIARDPSLSERDRRVLLAAVREMQREDDREPLQDTERPTNDSVPVARDAQPDGVTAEQENTAKRPLPRDVFGLAASRGPRGRDEIDRRAAEAGEESQDPEG